MRRVTAQLLTRLYPHQWRERYGVEFMALLEDGRGGLRASADIAWAAFREHLFPTQGGSMDQPVRSLGAIMKQPSAFLPLTMSLVAVTMVLASVARYGGGPGGDEGAVAHLWQLLMAGQVPIIAFFAIKWLPKAPKQALYVLAEQAGAALASMAAVFFFNLG